MNKEDLKLILDSHKRWLNGKDGEKANLCGANLNMANLSWADLAKADLRWADLSWANLSGVDLTWANLSGADLAKADLTWAKLSGADLCGANLSGADLAKADLSRANLSGADLCGANLGGARFFNTTGDNQKIKTIQAGSYIINIVGDIIQIGCERHSIDEWLNFSDDEFLKMDGQKALDFWAKWKSILMMILEK